MMSRALSTDSVQAHKVRQLPMLAMVATMDVMLAKKTLTVSTGDRFYSSKSGIRQK